MREKLVYAHRSIIQTVTMLLIVQIALGILLGYALIRNYDRIAKLAKPVLWGLLALLILGVVIIAGSLAMDAANDAIANNPKLSRLLETGLYIAVGAVCLGIFAIGASAFASLVDEVAPDFFKDLDVKGPWWKRLVGIALLLGFLSSGLFWSLPIFEGTAIGTVLDDIDEWSRSNGYKDAGSTLFVAITYLWPIPVLLAWRRWRGEREAPAPSRSTPPAE